MSEDFDSKAWIPDEEPKKPVEVKPPVESKTLSDADKKVSVVGGGTIEVHVASGVFELKGSNNSVPVEVLEAVKNNPKVEVSN